MPRSHHLTSLAPQLGALALVLLCCCGGGALAQQCELFAGQPPQCSQMIPVNNTSFAVYTFPEVGLTQAALAADLTATLPDYSTLLLLPACRGALWEFACANVFRRCEVDPLSGAAVARPPCRSQCTALLEHCDEATLLQVGGVDCNATNALVMQPEYPETGWLLPLPPPAPPGTLFELPCFTVEPDTPVPFLNDPPACEISADGAQLLQESVDQRGCVFVCPVPLTNTDSDHDAIAITIYVIGIIELVLFPLTVVPFLLRQTGRSVLGSLVTMYLFGAFLFAWAAIIPLMVGGSQNVVCQEDGSPANRTDPPACGAMAFLAVFGGSLGSMYGALIAVELFVAVWGGRVQRSVPPLARGVFYHAVAWCWATLWTVLPFALDKVGSAGGSCNVNEDIYALALTPLVIVLAVQLLFFTLVFVRIGLVLGKRGFLANVRLLALVFCSLLVGLCGICTYVYAVETMDEYRDAVFAYFACVAVTPPLPGGYTPCEFDSPLNFGFIYAIATFLPYFFQMCTFLVVLLDRGNLVAYVALFTCSWERLREKEHTSHQNSNMSTIGSSSIMPSSRTTSSG
jgi:Frizzled/Smoothened family membrane region